MNGLGGMPVGEISQEEWQKAEADRLRNMPINLSITEATGGYIISGDSYPYDGRGRQVVAVSIEDVLRIVERRLRRED